MSDPTREPVGRARAQEEEERIDAICDRFEAATKARESPRIEDYLAEAAPADRPTLLRELLAVELAYRRRAGESPTAKEYQGRFEGCDTPSSLFEPKSSSPSPGRLLLQTVVSERPDGTPLPDAPPSAAGPRFEVLGLHAEGGLGSIYRAHDRELDREVALKQIQDRYADRAESRRRFEWEARITGRLQHPGIVPVYTLGRGGDGRPYYAMRFIEGRSLKEAIAAEFEGRGGQALAPLRLRELLRRFLDACDAIAYAHSRGVVHRDIKPSNIMLGAFGETLVVDWGLAKLIAPVNPESRPGPEPLGAADGSALGETASGEILGTPAYMSPEQASGGQPRNEPASDIYGLGATLFGILTGRLPVEAGSPDEAIDRIRRGEIDTPRSVAPSVPRALDAICRKAMARRPNDRYADVSELADDVNRWLAGEPVLAMREPFPTRARRWLGRHRTAVTALAVSALAVAVVGTGVGIWHARQTALRRDQLEESHRSVLARYDHARSRPNELTEWRAALAAAEQAEAATAQLPESLPARRIRALRSEIASGHAAASRDLALLDELADLRLGRESSVLPDLDLGYLAAFKRYGVDFEMATTGAVASALRQRPPAFVREVAGYLDDWALVRDRSRPGPDRDPRPLEVARAIDPDPDRNRIRAAVEQTEEAVRRRVLLELAEDARKNIGLAAPSALMLAEALAIAGRAHESADLLRLTVDRYPTDLWANYDMAFHLARYHPDRSEEALRFYTAARAIRPDSGHEMAHLLEKRGRLGEAIALFEDLVRLRPDVPRHRSCLGAALAKVGRKSEAREALALAITAFRDALRHSPEDPVIHNNLGLALHESGDLNGAVEEYRAALRINPRHANASYNLGRALRALGRAGEAVDAYKASLEVEPGNSRALNNLGLALYSVRKLDEAADAYRAAIRFDPRLTVAHFNLSNVLRDQGRHEEAVNACRAALRIEPRNAKALNNLGLALAALDRRPEAADAYRAAIASNPKLTVAYFNLSNALRGMGLAEEAAETCRNALKLNPADARVHNNLGLALRDLGRNDEAVDAYRVALRLEPELPEALCNLGQALRDQGRFAEALDALERGHRIGSSRPGGWRYPTARWIAQCRRLLELEAELPAVLRGEIKPGADRIELADLCHKKAHYSVAARLYAEAFEASPGLAERPAGSFRHNAARSAARAADDRRATGPALTVQQRDALRARAMGWLKAELLACSRRLRDDPKANGRPLSRTLRHWQTDPDLESLRGEDALAALSEEDRTACRALWSEVETLLRSINENAEKGTANAAVPKP